MSIYRLSPDQYRFAVKQGQFVHYSITEDNLVNTLVNFTANFCPKGSPLKKESKRISAEQKKQ